MDADGNRSFTEALDASSQGSDTICEMDNLSPRQIPDGRRVIMVKSEVGVKSSVRNWARRCPELAAYILG